MKRKFTTGLLVTLAGLTAAFNVHLNRQKNTSTVSCGIEVLANKLSVCEQDDDSSTDPVILRGCLSDMDAKSLSMPFTAIKSYSSINVYYSINLSSITVKIVNASGQIVYSNTVNPVSGGQLYISLSGLPEGDYTILFTAPNGNSIYGDFEI